MQASLRRRAFPGARPTPLALAMLSAGALLVTPTPAAAEARISATASGALATSANLGVAVQVPRILYLRVGDVGPKVNTVHFDVGLRNGLGSLTARDQVYSGALPPGIQTTRGDDSGNSNGSVPVRLWTNNGSVTLDCSAPPLSAGANVIPLTAIRVSSSSTALRHPGTSLACAPASRGSAGVNDLNATWTYRYTPSSLPAAGVYATTVTYTASQP